MMKLTARVEFGIVLASIFLSISVLLAAAATAVPVDGLWQEFLFRGVGASSEGCQSYCAPSPSGSSEYAGDPPWEFTAPETGATLTVVDAASSGDVLQVYDFGSHLGSTSPSSTGTYCGFDPEICLENQAMSSGKFILGPGAHEITIVPSASPYNAGIAYFRLTSGIPSSQEIAIDVKPGSDPNSINCRNDNEMIAVAVLSTEGFDAAEVDHGTVTFSGASETHAEAASSQPMRHVEDIDRDGDIDLVFHFRLGETTLTCESLEGTIMGETWDGTTVKGSGSVRMSDPGSS